FRREGTWEVDCVDAARKNRRRRHHIEPVIRWNVEEILLASIRNRPIARITIPLEELVIVLRRVLREEIHDALDARVVIGIAPERKAKLAVFRKLFRDRDDRSLVDRDLR